MLGKLAALGVGLGAGYVLGARAGRQGLDEITTKARDVWNDPRVQERASQAHQLITAKTSSRDGSAGDPGS